jgi:hypothetical protein
MESSRSRLPLARSVISQPDRERPTGFVRTWLADEPQECGGETNVSVSG